MGSISGPSSARSTPAHRWAADRARTRRGRRRSGPGASSWKAGSVSSTARSAPPTSATAGASSPLSGPTSTDAPLPTSTATARRGPPTPGSTTARTTPGHRYWALRARARAPARMSWGGHLVGHVDHRHLGGDGSDDRVDDPDELVVVAVVGEEGDRVVAQRHGSPDATGPRSPIPSRRSARPEPVRPRRPGDRASQPAFSRASAGSGRWRRPPRR